MNDDGNLDQSKIKNGGSEKCFDSRNVLNV